MSGLFVVFEGGEGAGKSSLMLKLLENLAANYPQLDVVTTREPGGSRIGNEIRQLLLHSSPPISGRAEALLFAAERAQHVNDVILPALHEGKIVLCDRFVDSSIVYQGVARNLGYDEVAGLSDFATFGIIPDVVFLLDIDPKIGLKRKEEQKELNNMELEDIQFHVKVREAFLDRAKGSPKYHIIDATASVEEVSAEAWSYLSTYLKIEES